MQSKHGQLLSLCLDAYACVFVLTLSVTHKYCLCVHPLVTIGKLHEMG